MRISHTDLWEWHRWFAWHPVSIGHKTVWLECVERKMAWLPDICPISAYSVEMPGWTYRFAQ